MTCKEHFLWEFYLNDVNVIFSEKLGHNFLMYGNIIFDGFVC